MAAAARPKNAAPNGVTTSDLSYNGGSVVVKATVYAVFWVPPTLQDGSSTHISSGYVSLINQFLKDIGSSRLYRDLTQYCEGVSNGTVNCGNQGTAIRNSVTFGGAVLDSQTPYPSGACSGSSPYYPNCISDGEVQDELRLAISQNGWTANRNHVFFVFTAHGEGECSGFLGGCFADSSPNASNYCAYHSHFGLGPFGSGTQVIYGFMPYAASTTNCPGSNELQPNGDLDADTEIGVLSHELMEGATDPEPTSGWVGTGGNTDEIGDKCSYDFGTGAMPFNRGTANQIMNGHYYAVQREWDNLATPDPSDGNKKCAFSGPAASKPIADIIPNAALPGANVDLGGEDFLSGEPIDIEYSTQLRRPQPSSVRLCPSQSQASSDGSFRCSDSLPTGPLTGPFGTHKITIRGTTSQRQTTLTIQVSPSPSPAPQSFS